MKRVEMYFLGVEVSVSVERQWLLRRLNTARYWARCLYYALPHRQKHPLGTEFRAHGRTRRITGAERSAGLQPSSRWVYQLDGSDVVQFSEGLVDYYLQNPDSP